MSKHEEPNVAKDVISLGLGVATAFFSGELVRNMSTIVKDPTTSDTVKTLAELGEFGAVGVAIYGLYVAIKSLRHLGGDDSA